jgi:hypothetical protein
LENKLSVKYVGSTKNIIDWDAVIKNIVPRSGDFNTPNTVTDRVNSDPNAILSDYDNIMNTWKSADYNFAHIEWYDYYPGEHFDFEVQDTFAELVNAKPKRVFVSEVWPGYSVPYHWDVEDNEQQWLSEGRLVRFVCFMQKSEFGHVFILDKEPFYNVPQHEVYEWGHYRNFHSGSNSGVEPYYLFHFLGIAND